MVFAAVVAVDAGDVDDELAEKGSVTVAPHLGENAEWKAVADDGDGECIRLAVEAGPWHHQKAQLVVGKTPQIASPEGN